MKRQEERFLYFAFSGKKMKRQKECFLHFAFSGKKMKREGRHASFTLLSVARR